MNEGVKSDTILKSLTNILLHTATILYSRIFFDMTPRISGNKRLINDVSDSSAAGDPPDLHLTSFRRRVPQGLVLRRRLFFNFFQ